MIRQPRNGNSPLPRVCWLPLALFAVLLAASWCQAATWQYRVSFDRGPDKRGQRREPGDVLLWLPAESETIRGLLLVGRLGIEGELIVDPQVRDACRENDLGIVYFTPHLSGVFHYWEPGNRDGETLLRALDDLAECSGRDEVRRVPWITAGHSTAGIFARNVAYWKPDRVAGILHIKSGNFHQREHLPPKGSLAGVPLVAINGQLETYGPEGGIRPEFGRETQWVFVRQDIRKFREREPDHLISLLVHPGADHFHGAPEIACCAALFLAKTAEHCLPAELPGGSGPVACLPLAAEDGWLSDPDLYEPKSPAAPYDEYTGDKNAAFWHYDREIARATVEFHRNLGRHQVLTNPECAWLDEGDGWTFRARSEFLDTMPEKYGGRVGGKRVGHAKGAIIYRAKPNEPVARVGPDRFRLLRPARRVFIAAFHPGDEQYRSTIRWGSIEMPRLKDAKQQTIEFPSVPDLTAGSGPVKLRAKTSSGLPVFYEVDYGPVVVEDGVLTISEVPRGARFPMPCRITAHQIGRRTSSPVAPAEPVSITFDVVGP